MNKFFAYFFSIYWRPNQFIDEAFNFFFTLFHSACVCAGVLVVGTTALESITWYATVDAYMWAHRMRLHANRTTIATVWKSIFFALFLEGNERYELNAFAVALLSLPHNGSGFFFICWVCYANAWGASVPSRYTMWQWKVLTKKISKSLIHPKLHTHSDSVREVRATFVMNSSSFFFVFIFFQWKSFHCQIYGRIECWKCAPFHSRSHICQ